MPQIFEHFGVRLTDLYHRLEKTKTFTTNIKEVDSLLETLPPPIRNQLLNYGVGVEVEVENCAGRPADGWEVVADGSLRNHGVEYKTNYGHRIYHLIQSLSSLKSTLYSQDGNPQFSERTSIHVHLDVRTLTMEQLHSFVLVYMIFEDALFAISGEKREHNIYCTPFLQSTTVNIKPEVRSPSGMLKYFISQASKYTAMNLRCVTEFGTVEFRHMEGNCDIERIFKWVCLLGLLKCYAKSIPLIILEQKINDLKSQSHFEEFAREVFFDFAKLLKINPQQISANLSKTKLLLPEH